MNSPAAEIPQDEAKVVDEATKSKPKKESKDQRKYRESVEKLNAKPKEAVAPDGWVATPAGMSLPPPSWPGTIFWEDTSEKYIHVREDGTWVKVNERVVMRLLRGAPHLLSNRPPREGGLSDLEVVLEEIRNKHAVMFSGPRAGYFAGKVLDHNGERFLVTASPTPIEPREGEFPRILALLDGMFGEGEPRIIFLAWLKDAVEGLRSGGERQTGKALVLAGPGDSGKSFVQDHIVTPLLGGRVVEPYLFMSGATTFSDSLAGCEHWKIEDQGHSDPESRKDLAASLKQAVANGGITHHPKGKALRTVKAFRRLTISCNEEPKYLAILPFLDSSLEDKIVILRTSKGGIPEDHGDPEKQEAYRGDITRELPAFVHYILNLEIDPKFKARFGVIGFKDAEILKKLEETEPYHQLGEILDETFEGMGTESVEGSATKILALLGNGPCARQIQALCRGSARAIGRHLASLVKVFPDRYQSRQLDGRTEYTITGFPKKEEAVVKKPTIYMRAVTAAESAYRQFTRENIEKAAEKNGCEAHLAAQKAAEAVLRDGGHFIAAQKEAKGAYQKEAPETLVLPS
jgi:hypothetical protein